MTPREIQMKIRAGASVEEIAEASGMPIARVEAFAAPVLAERNHIAGLAQLGSVRRTGEPTGHRTLRDALGDRLKQRGVDPGTVDWDAFKMDDGRWSVSAAYRVEQADRVAVFYFDPRGRFSVSGNEEGRWAIGEQSVQAEVDADFPARPDDVDTEPTLKLAGPADELALLRAIETDEIGPEQEPELQPEPEPGSHDQVESAAGGADAAPEVTAVHDAAGAQHDPGIQGPTQPRDDRDAQAAVPDQPSQLDLLYDLLGSDGYAEDSIRVFEGLSDAAAVPDVADSAWQESGEEHDDPSEPAEQSSSKDRHGASIPESQPEVFTDGATQDTLPEVGAKVEHDAGPDAGAGPEGQAGDKPTESEATEPESAHTEAKPDQKPKKRKRASVPSWDEIMFGSPTPKGK